MIFTTLKANKENNVDYYDIMYYVDENWRLVADLFPNSEKYFWNDSDNYTDFDKLLEDYSPRQVASTCLKHLRERCKGKKPPLMIWQKMFIDLDCDGEIAFEQVKCLIEENVIKNGKQLREIDNLAKKKGCRIKSRDYCYDEENYYVRRDYISDLIDEHFPCQEKLAIDEDGDEYYECTNCGNC